jgi:hypothetical protein
MGEGNDEQGSTVDPPEDKLSTFASGNGGGDQPEERSE